MRAKTKVRITALGVYEDKVDDGIKLISATNAKKETIYNIENKNYIIVKELIELIQDDIISAVEQRNYSIEWEVFPEFNPHIKDVIDFLEGSGYNVTIHPPKTNHNRNIIGTLEISWK